MTLGEQVKLVIWDLDDTLWRGTLADGDSVTLIAERADLIRALNARGVMSSLCSKNDHAEAEGQLRAMGLWDEFVFPHIAFTPKPEAVRAIIEAMQLRPANVLFVDDNPHNLAGVQAALPEIGTLNATAEDADARLAAVLPAEGHSRVAEYRQMETRHRDRAIAATSDEAFLRSCDIHACAPFLMDNLDFVPRIAELINRSNQLNYTGSRVTESDLAAAIIDVVRHDSWSFFAWDRYGDYGLIGFAMVDRQTKRLIHFTFSCRIMHMGLERYALAKIREKQPDCDLMPLAGRVDAAPADWISDASFHDAITRDKLIAMLAPVAEGAPLIRVMFDCQSGGIAHFSRHRAAMDFDNAPRLFALRHILPGCVEHEGLSEPVFAPLLVYGAGVDYSDPRWPGLIDLLPDGGLFAGCVQMLCDRVTAEGRRMLVILPAEDAPDSHYRPSIGHTRERTALFNAIWRHNAAGHGGVTLFDLSGFATAEDMPDVSHYYAGFLQRLAGVVDDWVDQNGQDTQPQSQPLRDPLPDGADLLDAVSVIIEDGVRFGYPEAREMMLEGPVLIRPGLYDIDFVGAFTFMGGRQTELRHVGKIGRFCSIAYNIMAGAEEHPYDFLSPNPMFQGAFDWKQAQLFREENSDILARSSQVWWQRRDACFSKINIGNDVWIGEGAFIRRGISIGDGAVIAARAVVNRDVEPYAIVAGSPARLVRYRFEPAVVDALLDLKWWRYGLSALSGVDMSNIHEAIDRIHANIVSGRAQTYDAPVLRIDPSGRAGLHRYDPA